METVVLIIVAAILSVGITLYAQSEMARTRRSIKETGKYLRHNSNVLLKAAENDTNSQNILHIIYNGANVIFKDEHARSPLMLAGMYNSNP